MPDSPALQHLLGCRAAHRGLARSEPASA